MFRNPRVILGLVFCVLFAISQGVDQATQGKYPTPALTAEILKTAIVALSASGIIAEVVKRVFISKGPSDKPEIPKTEEDESKP
jgi:hypothetical protein